MLVQGDHSRLAGCRGHPGRTEAWGRAFEAVQLGVPWGLRGQTPWLLSPLPLTGCATLRYSPNPGGRIHPTKL